MTSNVSMKTFLSRDWPMRRWMLMDLNLSSIMATSLTEVILEQIMRHILKQWLPKGNHIEVSSIIKNLRQIGRSNQTESLLRIASCSWDKDLDYFRGSSEEIVKIFWRASWQLMLHSPILVIRSIQWEQSQNQVQ